MYTVVLLAAMSGGVDVPAFGHRNRCHGCDSGCSAPVACNGCSAPPPPPPAPACCGGGCSGCSGDCHGRKRHRLFGRKRHGCCGGSACCGGAPVTCCGGVVAPPPPDMKEKIEPNPKKDKEEISAPARVVVNLPADARLTIDGTTTRSTSDVRYFATPVLNAGRDFYYTFQATVVRDGRPVTAERRVRVHAGKQSTVRFDFASTGLVKN